MKAYLPFLLLAASAANCFGQATEPESPPPEEQVATSDAKSEPQAAKNTSDTPNEASRTVIGVKPGKPAIKTSEIVQQKPVSPWAHFPRHLLSDQKYIWTSPFRTSWRDAKWWALFGGATAALIATDKHLSAQLPNTKDQISVANITSKIGAAYTLVPVTAATYFIGTYTQNDKMRETGILGVEALVDALVVGNVLKIATQRQRPTEGNGNGNFWQGNGRIWNSGSSFPSGHAIETWALASVLAHEYPHKKIVPILGYTLAMAVTGSRFAARRHFASDVVAGAAMGWFIGDFVYGKRRNRDLDNKPQSTLHKILNHVQLGGGM